MRSILMLHNIFAVLGVFASPELQASLIRHHHYLLALLRYKTGSLHVAEDLLQETYLAFLNSDSDQARFSSDTKLKNYLITIALNKLRDYYRRESRSARQRTAFRTREELDGWLENVASSEADPGTAFVQNEERSDQVAAVALVMERLPDRHREILELKFTKGLENSQIAETLGMGIKAIESLLFRAKGQFKKEFTKICLSENVLEPADVDKQRTENHGAR